MSANQATDVNSESFAMEIVSQSKESTRRTSHGQLIENATAIFLKNALTANMNACQTGNFFTATPKRMNAPSNIQASYRALQEKTPLPDLYLLVSAKGNRDMISGLAPLKFFRNEVSFAQKEDWGMTGCGLLMVNAPFGAAESFRQAAAAANGILRQ